MARTCCIVPLAPLAFLAAIGCDYEAPLDPDAPRLLNAIDGEVVFAGAGEVGPTYVTLFDAADPPPPAGTGAPVTFAAVPPRAFTGDGAGLQSASYALTRIADGDWLVNALMDTDGDFNPFSSALAGATCGDWGGAHLADLLGTPAVVTVGGGEAVRNVTVLIGQPFLTERPVFALAGPSALSLADIFAGAPPLFRLRTDEIAASLGSERPLDLVLGPSCIAATCPPELPVCPCEVAACGTALWVELRDADADGIVNPYPEEPQASAGLLDVWPRVYLQHIADYDTFTYEGRTLPERWVTQAHPLAAEIAVAAATGAVPPGEAAAALGPIGEPFPASELSITFVPQFVHYHADGVTGVDAGGPFDLVDPAAGGEIPDGAWAVTVISSSGQTWTIPNDVGALDGGPQGAALIIE